MPDLFRMGAQSAPDELSDRVAAFRDSTTVIAGLVLPWNRSALASDLDLDDLSVTRAGTLWGGSSECSWRVEGGRALLTVLSDDDLSKLDMEQIQCEIADEPPVAWLRQPFSRGADVDAMHARTYLIDGVPAHRRLVAKES